MLAVVHSRALLGLEAPLIRVEVHLSGGLPSFNIVGLPETSVKEARDRVRSAIMNCKFQFPDQRITVNLAPADLPKGGGRFDLAIALGILAASNQVPQEQLKHIECVGELGLTGEIRATTGTLSAVLACYQAGKTLLISSSSATEAALFDKAKVLIADHLLQATGYLCGQIELPFAESSDPPAAMTYPDLDEVIGQAHAKRALMIAAAGNHHLLLMGPPGTGKSMLASRLPGLLPALSQDEALQAATVRSISGLPIDVSNWGQRPYRSPHHSASAAALIGGGSHPKPGEISLAHCGILFLDELTEFEKRVLDCLREPIETGEVTISRATRQVTFPAKFQLVAAMNPSPCGHYADGKTRANAQQILRYLSKLSGPFLDRFDLTVEVPLLPKGTLSQQPQKGLTSQQAKAQVLKAQHLQRERRGKLNQWLTTKEIDIDCRLHEDDAQFLENAIQKLGLSIRAWHRILKVSRTIADLDHSKTIERKHLAEAFSYRAMDRLLQKLQSSVL